MTRNLMAAAAMAALLFGAAGSAQAANSYAYMTGFDDPWGQQTNDAAMDVAFGEGNWDKFNGFDGSIFSAGYSFVYLDGGDGNGQGLRCLLHGCDAEEINPEDAGYLDAMLGYIDNGGRVFINAARNDDYSELATGLGTFLVGANFSSTGELTAAGLAAGLDGNGAGAFHTGNSYSHDVVGGFDTCYIMGSEGCVFASKGSNLFVGGQTAPYWIDDGEGNIGAASVPRGVQLWANELQFAAFGQVPTGAVPEPATWALMIGGFGLAGAALRRRRMAATA